MKALAGLAFSIGVTFTVAAIADESAVPFLLAGLACFAGSALAWGVARRRERDKLAALRSFRPRRERR